MSQILNVCNIRFWRLRDIPIMGKWRMLKCFSFSWYSSDPFGSGRIIITEDVIDDHGSAFCHCLMERSSEIILLQKTFYLITFNQTEIETQNGCQCVHTYSHQGESIDLWHGLPRSKVDLDLELRSNIKLTFWTHQTVSFDAPWPDKHDDTHICSLHRQGKK